MKAADIRRKYIEFFKSKGHAEIKSASLIPDNDPTCLFTTAGMHPLVPYLQGAKHPAGTRLTDFQKCIRTGDIDEVGDAVHLTFFEMLGNWSLGDYFKEEAIRFSFEFLTGAENLNIPLNMLAVTVFAGDEDCPFDEEAFKLWNSLGIPAERIAKLPKKDNWWGPAGQTGPCGPDTEMFYWTGDLPAPEKFEPSDKRWVEIWNDVFMQYNKNAEGKYEPLSQRNVDTGMGLERVTAILQGKKSCYETEIFAPLFAKLDEIRGAEWVDGAAVFALLKVPPGTGSVIQRVLSTEVDSVDLAQCTGIDQLLCCPNRGIITEVEHQTDFQVFICGKSADLVNFLQAGAKGFVADDMFAFFQSGNDPLTADAVVITHGKNIKLHFCQHRIEIGVSGFDVPAFSCHFCRLSIFFAHRHDFKTAVFFYPLIKRRDMTMPQSDKSYFFNTHFNTLIHFLLICLYKHIRCGAHKHRDGAFHPAKRLPGRIAEHCTPPP